MCKICKAKRKKKQRKFVKHTKLGVGLFAGSLLGMLFAPKKGSDSRAYLKSVDFKSKINKAQRKALEAKEFLHDRALTATGGFQRFWMSVRKRFGM